MKFIHAADLHLGSKLNSNFDPEKSKERRTEIEKSFKKMIEFAKNNEIKVIVLAGDVFDKDKVSLADKSVFFRQIRSNPNIDFIYLKGNHDCEFSVEEKFLNLKTFSGEWTTYDYEDVSFTGIEMNNENKISLYKTLKLNPNRKNVVIMHGTIGNEKKKDIICIKDLIGKNIDYLALGHIHKRSEGVLEEGKSIYVYPGCLDGRGFDETGEKGFYLIDSDDNFKKEFIPQSSRIIYDEQIDVTDAKSIDDLSDIISNYLKDKGVKKEDIVRVKLVGQSGILNPDLIDIIKRNLDDYFYFVIEDETTIKIDLEFYKNDMSLKGYFVRKIMENKDLSDDQKKNAITIGFRYLEDGEIKQ